MIYVFLAHGFEEIEALTVVDVLRRAELPVSMVGVGSKTITGSHGITVHCNIAEREVTLRDMEMLVLPGGIPGTLNLEKSKTVQACIDHAVANEIWLGAICAAPSILGHKGLLEDKTVTCAPGFDTQLGNADYTGNSVEVDGKLITADGAGSAMAFALKLCECLTSAERAKTLGDSMQVRGLA